jgi:hypothetical protein
LQLCQTTCHKWAVKEEIQHHLAQEMGALNNPVHLTEGFPMPVCVITRASRNRCFLEEAVYGYCASKDEHDYGFEGHLVVSSEGVMWLSLCGGEHG